MIMITKEAVIRELPEIIRNDEEIRQIILKIVRQEFLSGQETESRFDRVLDELKRDRELQEKRWREYQEEQNRKWEDQNAKWEDENEKWKEQNRKWEDENEKWKEQNRKWDDENEKWKEQNRKWDENQKVIRELFKQIDATAKKSEKSYRRLRDTISAMGARWGLKSEASFRNGLRAILEEIFGVKVVHVNERDEEGIIFGRPDQVELDILIHNGLLIICEIKSSMSKGDMYLFEKKVRYYEKTHQCKCDRMIVISPMVDSKATDVADDLDIEVYSHSDDVEI